MEIIITAAYEYLTSDLLYIDLVSPLAIFLCPHQESRYLLVPRAPNFLPQIPAVEDAAGHS